MKKLLEEEMFPHLLPRNLVEIEHTQNKSMENKS